jgi:hypothetical protein
MSARPKSPGALVAAVRIARANPNARFEIPHDFPITSAEVLALFSRGLTARCNRGLVISTSERATLACLDGRRVNEYVGQRIRHTGCSGLLRSPAMQRRYPHINRQPATGEQP